MKTFESDFKVWQNDDGEFCIYFPNTRRLFWGFSYTSNAHDVGLVLSCDDEYDAKYYAAICLGEGSEDDFEYSDITYEEYLDAVESGEKYDILLDYFQDYVIAKEPNEKTITNLLITDILR